jgi:hypothetical protein
LIENFNSSSHATQKYARVATGTPGSGKADNFFNNGYFKMEDLKKIVGSNASASMKQLSHGLTIDTGPAAWTATA